MAITIQSVPAGHPYPQEIAHDAPQQLRFLPDSVVDPADPTRWWPHPALDAGYYSDGPGAEIDILHVHFGFEHLTLAQTQELTTALRDRDIALVLTIHDLDNPHLADQEAFHQQVAHLACSAQHVFTLSQSAADQVQQRWGVSADVRAHPPIAAGYAVAEWEDRTSSPGVFLKSMRSNVVTDPEFYRALAAPPATVYLHTEAADNHPAIHARADIVHEPMDDDTLFDAIASHQVVVLPYLRGTHSGWMTMCRDLGTSVAVPDCGCYLSQAQGDGDTPDAGVEVYRSGDGADAARAVRELLARGPITAPKVDTQAFRQRHYQVYRQLGGEQQ